MADSPRFDESLVQRSFMGPGRPQTGGWLAGWSVYRCTVDKARSVALVRVGGNFSFLVHSTSRMRATQDIIMMTIDA